MTASILSLITEWRRGCGNVEQSLVDGEWTTVHPEQCTECTRALIDAIEREASASAASNTVTFNVRVVDDIPEVKAMVEELRADRDDMATRVTRAQLLLDNLKAVEWEETVFDCRLILAGRK